MSLRSILPVFLMTLAMNVCAQKVRTVSMEYTYYPPENLSLEQAKKTAVERARIEAIAVEFGTNVSQTNTTVISSGDSQSSFNAVGMTEVKGDWIADVKEPEYDIIYDKGILVIKVRVEGKVRERNSADVELSIKTLCNGMESETFKDNDRFSVSFRSAAKGSFSIWLIDDNQSEAYCLLPYENEGGSARMVENRKEYVFLSTADPTYPYREETILTTEKDIDFNRLVFVFSSNEFSMPLTDDGEFHPVASTADLERWLSKNRLRDEEMQVIYKTIEIRKK